MNNSYLFSFIIGYRHRQDRIQNLRRVIDWLSGFGGIEIIIVEQDKSPKLNTFTFKGIKHIFTKSNSPYNRSWAFNVGIKHSSTNVLVFGDSDLLIEPNQMISSLKMIDHYDCVSPYSSVLDLTQQESQLSLDQMVSINRPGRGENDNQKINLCGGVVMYRKDSIIKIGGWCEDFIGWGAEDDFQAHKTKMFLKYFENSGTCYHLWHDRSAPDPAPYQRNLQLLNKLVTLTPQDMQKHINASIQKIGMKNKLES